MIYSINYYIFNKILLGPYKGLLSFFQDPMGFQYFFTSTVYREVKIVSRSLDEWFLDLSALFFFYNFKLTDYRPGLILIIFLDLEDWEILLGHKMPPGWED